jgi:hypothetical protein
MESSLPTQNARLQTEREFLMDAPLLKNLEAQLKVCKSQKEWAILRAKQALYLARTHRIAEAAQVPDEIRKVYRGKEDSEVFFWVWLTEGVVDFYQTATTRMIGQFKRAQAIALTMGLSSHVEYVSAWLANSFLRDDKHEDMIRSLTLSAMDRALFPEAVCRSSVVAAVAFQTVGDDKVAALWFGKARDTARTIGDRATIMASIENRALMRLDRVWVKHVLDEVSNREISLIESELLGALQYEKITGSESFGPQGDVARIRLHILRGRYDVALQEMTEKSGVLNDGKYPVATALAVLHEWLLCQVVGRRSPQTDILSKLSDLIVSLDDDDAVVCWRYLGFISHSYGDVARTEECISRSDDAYLKYCRRIENLRSSLTAWQWSSV